MHLKILYFIPPLLGEDDTPLDKVGWRVGVRSLTLPFIPSLREGNSVPLKYSADNEFV
jgi:hypothetical protein